MYKCMYVCINVCIDVCRDVYMYVLSQPEHPYILKQSTVGQSLSLLNRLFDGLMFSVNSMRLSQQR